jgi:DAK2 domain fusion protein YloV
MYVNRDAQGDLSASYSISGADFQKLLAGASRHFATKVEMMNALNVFPVPDGDTGTNMWLTLQAAVDSVNRLGDADLGRVADTAAIGALMGARGNSGVILSQFFRGMARGFSGKERASIPQVAKAFQYGVVMAYRAVSKPVEGTILTVAREMARGGKIAAKEGSTLGKLLEDAFEAGKIALERTTEQLPVLKEAGVVDSGGCGMLVLLEGFLKVAKGETIAELSEAEVYQPAEGLTDASEQKHLTYNYCTEALVKGTNLRVRRLREDLEPMGDSLIVVGDDKVAKVHIHTNHPGEVLELCLKRGTLHKIKIDNMLDQHRDTGFFKGEHAGDVDAVKTSAEEAQGVGLVVVGSGPGIEEIFRNVGANRIISGGPTMNPTVQEFVDAIRVFSNGVVILPNDKNIRLAAEQASTMVNRNVAVIPTKNIPEGIAATMAFDPQASVEENLEAMTERIQEIKSAEITFSVRDSTIGGLSLEKGDIIGIMEGKVAAAGESKEQVLLAVIEAMVEEDDGIISVIYGADVGQAEVEAIEREIKAKYPDMDTEFLSGGQPLYYFYVSVE